jgi:hypothetical protein
VLQLILHTPFLRFNPVLLIKPYPMSRRTHKYIVIISHSSGITITLIQEYEDLARLQTCPSEFM